jgi:hypothetical protein
MMIMKSAILPSVSNSMRSTRTRSRYCQSAQTARHKYTTVSGVHEIASGRSPAQSSGKVRKEATCRSRDRTGTNGRIGPDVVRWGAHLNQSGPHFGITQPAISLVCRTVSAGPPMAARSVRRTQLDEQHSEDDQCDSAGHPGGKRFPEDEL